MVNPNSVVLKGTLRLRGRDDHGQGRGHQARHASWVDHKGSWGRDDWDGHGWDDKSADSTTADASEKKKPEWKPQWFSASESVKVDTKDPKGFYSVKVYARGFDGKLLHRLLGLHGQARHLAPAKPPKGPKATRIVDFNAGPEPVKKGRSLTLTGQLQVAQCYGDWYYDRSTTALTSSSTVTLKAD